MWYVYILKCNDKRSYIGCTNNLKERITRHKKGYVSATKTRLPVVLISYFALSNKERAFKLEQYFKSDAGRTFLKKRIFNPGGVA